MMFWIVLIVEFLVIHNERLQVIEKGAPKAEEPAHFKVRIV